MSIDLKDHIRSVPNFPKDGILFYDIGTLLSHGPAWKEAVTRMTTLVEQDKPDYLVAIEARGFLIGAPIAAQLGIGLLMVRKKGKLPGRVSALSYDLEYGSDTIEMQTGLIQEGQRCVLIDDLLATGGTASAAIELARQQGALITRAVFIVELPFLMGRNRLDVPVSSLLTYDK